jgi:hypothetical protein
MNEYIHSQSEKKNHLSDMRLIRSLLLCTNFCLQTSFQHLSQKARFGADCSHNAAFQTRDHGFGSLREVKFHIDIPINNLQLCYTNICSLAKLL